MLTEEERARYSRQIMMPEIGEEGQEKLRQAKIVIAGVGGLGAISAYYLAAAGVGHIRIIDKDSVSISNLNRQLLHWTDDIGRPKVLSAQDKLQRLNPHCTIEAIEGDINAGSVLELVGDAKVIIDATDNILTRIVLNYASLEKKIPFIYGGVEGFNGMVSTFFPPYGPCFECVFPGIRDTGKVPAVIGPLPGIVSSMQALEAIKYITGTGTLLVGNLLYILGADMTTKKIIFDKNSACNVCKNYA